MLPIIKGRVAWKFAEPHFDVDNIIGVQNIKLKQVEDIIKVCMKPYEEDFADKVQEGDVLVGGINFGYGHPHYGAFKGLRAMGIKAVFAENFSPGFYRGEIVNGLPLIEAPGILDCTHRWDTLELDWEREEVVINGTRRLKCSPIPQKTKDLIESGGQIQYIREKRLSK